VGCRLGERSGHRDSDTSYHSKRYLLVGVVECCWQCDGHRGRCPLSSQADANLLRKWIWPHRTALVFGLSGKTTLSVYLGKALQNEGISELALKNFVATISTTSVSGGLAMQLCGLGPDADHVFGVIAAVSGTFAIVQSAVQLWSKAECLNGFSKTSNITGPIFVTAPPLVPISNNTNINELSGFNNTNSTTTAILAAPITWTCMPRRLHNDPGCIRR
jgi:hypothetical protein